MEHAVVDTQQTTGRVADLMEAWRAGRLRCATSGQVIRGRFVRRDGQVYHPDHAPADRPIRATVAPASTIIGRIGGVAARFNVINAIRAKNGAQHHDKLASGCFARSIDRGQTQLRLNHGAVVGGQFRRLSEDAGCLVWEFTLDDTPVGRGVLHDVASGAVTACSIGYTTHERAWDGSVEVVQDADLIEISILKNAKPAIWDTYVQLLA